MKSKCSGRLKNFFNQRIEKNGITWTEACSRMNHFEHIARAKLTVLYSSQRRAGGGVHEVKGCMDCGECVCGTWYLQISLCLGEWPHQGKSWARPSPSLSLVIGRVPRFFLEWLGGGVTSKGLAVPLYSTPSAITTRTSSKRALVICHRKQPINIC